MKLSGCGRFAGASTDRRPEVCKPIHRDTLARTLQENQKRRLTIELDQGFK